MTDDAPQPVADEPLFCPFCRDTYDGTDVCPTHGLALVRFMELPKQKDPADVWPDEQSVPRWSPRFGRVLVAAGAVLVVASFWLPWLRLFRPTETEVTAFVLARQALNLWSVPLAATTLLVILATRLSPVRMRSARLATALIALMPLANVGLTFTKIFRAAGDLGTRVEPAWGPAVTIAGVVLALAGAARLGVRSKADRDALRDLADAPAGPPPPPSTIH